MLDNFEVSLPRLFDVAGLAQSKEGAGVSFKMKTKYFRTATSYIVPSTVSRAASTVTTTTSTVRYKCERD